MSRKDNNFKSDEERSDDNADNNENEDSEESEESENEASEETSQEDSAQDSRQEVGEKPRYEFKPVERPADGKAKPASAAAKKSGRSGRHAAKFIMFAGVFIIGILIGAAAMTSAPAATGGIVSGDSSLGGVASLLGDDIGAEAAAAMAVDYIAVRLEQSYPGIEVEYESVSESADIPGTYEVMITMTFQGQPQNAPYHVTKDGNWMFGGLIDLNEELPEPTQPAQPAGTEVPKSDRPVVELFIWSYCPYGVQAQGPLTDVASLLGEDADFEVVLYHDGHGAYETQQNKIQACIQEVAADKYWEYAAGFVDNIYPKCSSQRDVECENTESASLMQTLGIDDAEVMSCVDERGEDLLAEHISRAGQYGVTGSPSIIINGVRVNVARNSEAFKAAVCDAFNDAPEECGETLSSSSAAASGNC